MRESTNPLSPLEQANLESIVWWVEQDDPDLARSLRSFELSRWRRARVHRRDYLRTLRRQTRRVAHAVRDELGTHRRGVAIAAPLVALWLAAFVTAAIVGWAVVAGCALATGPVALASVVTVRSCRRRRRAAARAQRAAIATRASG
jgi:hypothetical protein